MPSAAKPQDDVDKELLRLLRERDADSSLAEEAKVWGLTRPAVVKELQLLATTVEGASVAVDQSALVDADHTCPRLEWYESNVPLLFEQLVCRLFVGDEYKV